MAQTKLNNSQLPDTIQNKTIDTSNDIDTTTAKLTITGGSNGQVLSTDGSGNLSWATAGGGLGAPIAVVTKTADESVTSSNTPQNDDELSYALTANKTYIIHLRAIFSRLNTTSFNSPRFAIDAASSGCIFIGTNVALCDGTSTAVMQPTGAPADARVHNIAYISLRPTTNITLQVLWAQSNANTNTVTMYAGSELVIWEVA